MILMVCSKYCKKSVKIPLKRLLTSLGRDRFWVCFIPFSVPWAELLSCVQRGSSTENPCTNRQIRHNRSIQKDTESVLAHVSTVRMNTASCSSGPSNILLLICPHRLVLHHAVPLYFDSLSILLFWFCTGVRLLGKFKCGWGTTITAHWGDSRCQKPDPVGRGDCCDDVSEMFQDVYSCPHSEASNPWHGPYSGSVPQNSPNIELNYS